MAHNALESTENKNSPAEGGSASFIFDI